jgi:beta-galactosidase/beta-glucuronidase
VSVKVLVSIVIHHMAQPHRMHLKGPWDFRWIAQESPVNHPRRPEVLLDGQRIKMPAAWQDSFGAATGRVEFTRRFQKPTNLDEQEQVHIAFDGLGGSAVIRLNDELIGELSDIDATVSFDVTEKLQSTNLLRVEVAFDGGDKAGGLWGPVAIEIHNAVPWD